MAIQEEEEENLSDFIPAPWSVVSKALSHLNGVLLTALIVLGFVVAYIMYIIHLYDSGKLGGNEHKKPRRFRKLDTGRTPERAKRWMSEKDD